MTVVPPPSLKSLAIRLVAPEYTGVPPQTLAPGLTQFRALDGTRIELEGMANKPLAPPSCGGPIARQGRR